MQVEYYANSAELFPRIYFLVLEAGVGVFQPTLVFISLGLLLLPLRDYSRIY